MAADHDTTEQDAAWRALAAHRWWNYRACAPSPSNPKTSRTDPTVPLTAWQTPDRETQPERRAREEQATSLCGRCPMREQCLAYALGDQAGPYEQWDIWGGMTARQRTDLTKTRRRHAAGLEVLAAADTATALDHLVLRALAAHRSPQQVAATTGLTAARANWHRARLVTLLHLDPGTTTRMQLLYAARRTTLLDPRTPLLTDRDRIIAAIPSRQAAVVRSRGIQLWLPGMHALAEKHTTTNQAGPDTALHLLPATTNGHAAATTVLAAAA
jgi:hypothetical protein